MPRTWGYLAVAVAVAIGFAALLMPLPETIEIEPPAEVAPHAVPKAAPARQPARSRARQQAEQSKHKPAPGAFPMQDTTKSRLLIPQRRQDAS